MAAAKRRPHYMNFVQEYTIFIVIIILTFNNNISIVRDGLKMLINTNQVESYFSGNEKLCKSDKSLDCEPLCHKYCFSRKVANDGYCDVDIVVPGKVSTAHKARIAVVG